MLKNVMNCFGVQFNIRENLTFYRRTLRDRAEKELTSFHSTWVRNGSVYAKKSSRSRPIKIKSEYVLNTLIHEQAQQRAAKNQTTAKVSDPTKAPTAAGTVSSVPIHSAADITSPIWPTQKSVSPKGALPKRHPPRSLLYPLSHLPPMSHNRNTLLSPGSIQSMYNSHYHPIVNGGDSRK